MALRPRPQTRSRITRLDHHRGLYVLEAEAPLANLLGYGQWLIGHTDGSTDRGMRLSRSVPIDDNGACALFEIREILTVSGSIS